MWLTKVSISLVGVIVSLVGVNPFLYSAIFTKCIEFTQRSLHHFHGLPSISPYADYLSSVGFRRLLHSSKYAVPKSLCLVYGSRVLFHGPSNVCKFLLFSGICIASSSSNASFLGPVGISVCLSPASRRQHRQGQSGALFDSLGYSAGR